MSSKLQIPDSATVEEMLAAFPEGPLSESEREAAIATATRIHDGRVFLSRNDVVEVHRRAK